MAASKHRAGSRPADPTSQSDPEAGPVEALLDQGTRLRLRAPELAMVCGERAASLAEAADMERLWIHAEALVVFARVRLGHRASVVDRAMAALRAAEAGGHRDLIALLRTDLALCSRSIGVPLTGFAALRPVLTTRDTAPADRAVALVQLVGCLSALGRRGALDRALNEAGELVDNDPALDEDGRLTLHAAICGRAAAHLRRHGDISASVDFARRGLETIDGLSDSSADGGQLGVRLTLELTCALLDSGARDDAAALAEPVLREPPRAAAISPMAWLRLAVATRIHLPSGSAEAAAGLVREALYYARRHDLHAVVARLLHELAHIEQQLDRPSEAVYCLQEARIAEHSYIRARKQASALLTGEFGKGEHTTVDIESLLSSAHPQHLAPGRQRAAQPTRPAQPTEAGQPAQAGQATPFPAQTRSAAGFAAARASQASQAAQTGQGRQATPAAQAVRGGQTAAYTQPGGTHGSRWHTAGQHNAAQDTAGPYTAGQHAAPPYRQGREPESPAQPTHAAPPGGAPEPEAPAASVGSGDQERQHGDSSATARDVLARLGVHVGSGGSGRRRADDRAAETGGEPGSSRDRGPGYATAGPPGQGGTADGSTSPGESPLEFPRLRVPEGLEPPGTRQEPVDGTTSYGREGDAGLASFGSDPTSRDTTAGGAAPAEDPAEQDQQNFDEMDSLLEVFSSWRAGSGGAGSEGGGDGPGYGHPGREGRAVPFRRAAEHGSERTRGTNGRSFGSRSPGGRHRGET